MLARVLGEDYGLILSKDFHLIYQLDKEFKGYIGRSFDDVKKIVADYLGEYITNYRDVEVALTHIDKRLTPEHNIVKFHNCLFGMIELKPVESENPVFTLIESAYNYNPKSESQLIKEFLYNSLNRGSKEETAK